MIELTPKQQKRVDYIKEEGFEVTVSVVYDKLISVVAHKDTGCIFNDEHYHIFIGPRGAVRGVSTGNFMIGNEKERREHSKVLLSLFFFKVFNGTRGCTIKLM